MVYNTRIIRTKSVDPWWNLAIEENLLENVRRGETILYLWRNDKTVVIGRNQNPWRECRTNLLESDAGKLARRLSGGGAVYHDMGNLNFTFIAGSDVYDQDRQLSVVLKAVNSLGIAAEKSGRNDLIVDGRKFSGNAFCYRKNSAYHHGTILVSTDIDKLSKYLQVSRDKISSKGVKSVSSRVVNLSELKTGLDVDAVADALIAAFREEYGCSEEVEKGLRRSRESRTALEELYCKYSSWAWRYGNAPEFDVQIETRFPWGGVEMAFKLEDGIVSHATIYSDAMNEAYIAGLATVLKGCRYNASELAERIYALAGGGNLALVGARVGNEAWTAGCETGAGNMACAENEASVGNMAWVGNEPGGRDLAQVGVRTWNQAETGNETGEESDFYELGDFSQGDGSSVWESSSSQVRVMTADIVEWLQNKSL